MKVLLAIALLAGCKQSTCEKFAAEVVRCGLPYGPAISTKSEAKRDIGAMCDVAMEHDDKDMQAVAECVLDAASCDEAMKCNFAALQPVR